MEVYRLVMVIQWYRRRRRNVIHVGNFPSRSEYEQALRNATRPATVGTASDHAASFAYAPAISVSSCPRRRQAEWQSRIPIAFPDLGGTCFGAASRPRLLWARPKNKPRQSGAKSKGGNAPVKGHPQNIRVGCACYGQLQLAPACDFWNTVFDETFHRRTFCCRNGAILRPSDEESS